MTRSDFLKRTAGVFAALFAGFRTKRETWVELPIKDDEVHTFSFRIPNDDGTHDVIKPGAWGDLSGNGNHAVEIDPEKWKAFDLAGDNLTPPGWIDSVARQWPE